VSAKRRDFLKMLAVGLSQVGPQTKGIDKCPLGHSQAPVVFGHVIAGAPSETDPSFYGGRDVEHVFYNAQMRACSQCGIVYVIDEKAKP